MYGTIVLPYLTHNMGNFLDILSGRIFNFRNATGEDVNAGTSDKLIVTPKALSKSDAYSNTSIPLVFASSLSTKSSSFTANQFSFVVPTNGFFFPNRKPLIQAQLFVYVIAEAASTGEICLVDPVTNAVVQNTTFSFNNTAWACIAGNITTVEAGKAYTIAIRRSAGSSGKTVQVKAAILTLKLLSV
jgi:hypothetical protein